MIWAKIWSRRRWALSMLGGGVGLGLLVIFELGLAASFAQINRDSGLRAGLTCPGDPEFFLAGTAPLEA